MRYRFWIVFIIFLVVSITPASASQRSDLNNGLADANIEMKNGADDLTQHGDNVAGYAIAIKDFMIDIWNCNCFIISNSWKWWKLREIWNHICQIGMDGYYINDNIDNTANEGIGLAISSLMLLISSIVSVIIVIKFEKLLPPLLNINANTQTVETTKDVTQDITDLNSSDENGSTTQNNSTLQSKTTVPSNHNTPVEELHQGDVVIYKSQGKYLRYLQFITTDNQTVYLTGPYDKSITLPFEDFKKYYTGTDMRGDPKNLKASSKKVNNLYQTQKKDINNRINQNQEDTKNSEDGRFFSAFACVVSLAIFAVALLAIIITYYSQQKPSLDKAAKLRERADRHEMYNKKHFGYYGDMFDLRTRATEAADVASEAGKIQPFYIFVAFASGVSAIISGVFWSINVKSLDKLNDEGKKLADELADLNSWAVTENLTAPVAGCLNFTTHEGSGVNATFNGTDVYDDPLSYSNVSQPTNGNLTLAEGGFYYRSNPGFTGNDTFSYRANDDIWENLFSNVANVTVTVNPDHAPVASNMSLFTATNMHLNGVLDVNDPDNDNMTCSLVDGPLHGALNLNEDGSFVYTPFDNFTGDDSLTFKANDSVLNSSIGNVTIHVVNNTSPVAYNLVFNIGQNSILNSKFDVKSINGTEQLFSIVSKPGHGVLNIFGGNFSYKPVKNYNGRDMFTYKFTDVLNQTSNLATIQIFIRNPPTAESFKLSTRMNTMLNSVFRISGYNSTSRVVSKPQHGTLMVLSNERFSYKPNKDFTGKDTFTYQSVDKLGQKSPVATVTLSVTKPKPHKLEPPKRGDSKKFSSPLSALNTPHINAPHLEALHFNLNNLNATNLNMGGLNLTNINPENPTELFTNPLTQLIKEALNKIKTTINNLKL